MTERELDAEVRRLLADHGLYGYHNPDSRRSSAGMPDWLIIGSRVLWRELKSARGVLSPQQTRMRYRLLAARQNWAVWRPADLTSGRIEAELAAIV